MSRAVRCTVVLLSVLAVGACGDSPEDQARDDGEQVGEAVRALYDAESAEDAGEAIDELRAAGEDIREDTRERVEEQLETQRGSLDEAREAVTSGDPTALKEVAQQVRSQASSFRSGNDSIANEFWRGVEDGYED